MHRCTSNGDENRREKIDFYCNCKPARVCFSSFHLSNATRRSHMGKLHVYALQMIACLQFSLLSF
jgi:hypothetical protein